MPPKETDRRPPRGNGDQDDQAKAAAVNVILTREADGYRHPDWVRTCPCGCKRSSWYDDPACIRNLVKGVGDPVLDYFDSIGLCVCWVGHRRHPVAPS